MDSDVKMFLATDASSLPGPSSSSDVASSSSKKPKNHTIDLCIECQANQASTTSEEGIVACRKILSLNPNFIRLEEVGSWVKGGILCYCNVLKLEKHGVMLTEYRLLKKFGWFRVLWLKHLVGISFFLPEVAGVVHLYRDYGNKMEWKMKCRNDRMVLKCDGDGDKVDVEPRRLLDASFSFPFPSPHTLEIAWQRLDELQPVTGDVISHGVTGLKLYMVGPFLK
ncbi:hypothetical protein L6452_03110 [Arctium lappa]|uniref:Uncharacterized protein n=1 Tax=Arctium lappa TaxID=4217 RepID=A0ACB9FKR4_ARCLA|nr:hypothetical protein L6452_03110 [Arctium lappa]